MNNKSKLEILVSDIQDSLNKELDKPVVISIKRKILESRSTLHVDIDTDYKIYRITMVDINWKLGIPGNMSETLETFAYESMVDHLVHAELMYINLKEENGKEVVYCDVSTACKDINGEEIKYK